MSYNIIVDNREIALIKVLQKCFPQVYVSKLEVGDIAICKIDNQNHAKIMAIFERKTIPDMLSSVKDGRYREQKIRLMSYHITKKTERIYYILEGDTDKLSKEDDKRLWGMWISTQIRDGVEVIRTTCLDETVKFLIRFLERLIADGDNLLQISKYRKELYQGNTPSNTPSNTTSDTTSDTTSYNTSDDKHISLSYLATIKSKKKDNITPKICQIMSLGLIPNVSHAGADAVISKYGSLVNLIKEYANLPTEDEKKLMLADIQVSEKRKFGKVASEKIYSYLFC